jgi:hypothetical protein
LDGLEDAVGFFEVLDFFFPFRETPLVFSTSFFFEAPSPRSSRFMLSVDTTMRSPRNFISISPAAVGAKANEVKKMSSPPQQVMLFFKHTISSTSFSLFNSLANIGLFLQDRVFAMSMEQDRFFLKKDCRVHSQDLSATNDPDSPKQKEKLSQAISDLSTISLACKLELLSY